MAAVNKKNNTNICNELLAKYAPQQRLQIRKNISTSEKGIHYRAVVNPERETIVFLVDGCIIRSGDKCDRLILSRDPEHPQDPNSWIGHLIELKRGDVEHAVSQLRATILHKDIMFGHSSLKKKYARIVSTRMPSNSGDLSFEKYRKEFRKDYQCELKTLKNNQPERI